MSVNLRGELGVMCEVGSVSPFLFRLLKKGELLITCTELFSLFWVLCFAAGGEVLSAAN